MAGCRGIILRKGRILMLRHGSGKAGYWALPGGGIDGDELPEESIVREVEEECGIQARVVRLLTVNHFGQADVQYCFLLDAGDAEPRLGSDPEVGTDVQVLTEVRFIDPGTPSWAEKLFLLSSGGFVVSEIREWALSSRHCSKKSDQGPSPVEG